MIVRTCRTAEHVCPWMNVVLNKLVTLFMHMYLFLWSALQDIKA